MNKIAILILSLVSYEINASSYLFVMDKKDSNSIKVIDYEENNQPEITPPVIPSDETTSGNIAMLNTNGLTASSYSASSTYGSDTPRSAFDGFIYDTNLNVGGVRQARGLWLSNTSQTSNQWVSIDFGKIVSISGFKIKQHSGSASSRFPKNIKLQYSIDGITYEDAESLLLNQVFEVNKSFSEFQTQYFRFLIVDNYGGNYSQLSELEIYQ